MLYLLNILSLRKTLYLVSNYVKFVQYSKLNVFSFQVFNVELVICLYFNTFSAPSSSLGTLVSVFVSSNNNLTNTFAVYNKIIPSINSDSLLST